MLETRIGGGLPKMINPFQHVTYLGIIVTLILTGAGLPIPEEIIVIVAGVAAANGTLDVWFAFAACLIGALLGDCLMYWIGRHFGRRLLHSRGWYTKLLHTEREKTVERLIERHGMKVFVLSRFLVGLRSPVYLTAGILKVPFRRFVLIDTFCAAIVISFFFFGSYFFADRAPAWFKVLGRFELALTIVVVIAFLALGIYWYKYHYRGGGAPDPPDSNSDSNSDQSPQ